jgi:hypothetical protein
MHCYVHGDTPAIGVCKCCAKGVCRACAIPVTNGLACSEACKPTAEALSQLQLTSLHNASLYRAQRSIQTVAAIGLLAIGASVLFFGQSVDHWMGHACHGGAHRHFVDLLVAPSKVAMHAGIRRRAGDW